MHPWIVAMNAGSDAADDGDNYKVNNDNNVDNNDHIASNDDSGGPDGCCSGCHGGANYYHYYHYYLYARVGWSLAPCRRIFVNLLHGATA